MIYNKNMPKKTPTPKKAKPYKITAKFNEKTFVKKTDNIPDAILSIKPEQLFTDVYIIVESGEHEMERHLNLQQGKNLFSNKDFLDIFINNLILI